LLLYQVMMGIHFTGKAPFEVIYMHGLVRDASGAKMSKTKGNVVDPLATLEKFGTDALRYKELVSSLPRGCFFFPQGTRYKIVVLSLRPSLSLSLSIGMACTHRYSLVTGVTPGQDVPLSMEKVSAAFF
jgi:hypothetical protein